MLVTTFALSFALGAFTGAAIYLLGASVVRSRLDQIDELEAESDKYCDKWFNAMKGRDD